MKSALCLCLLCLLCVTGAWAGVVGTTNPALFPNTIDWCAQPAFNCNDAVVSSPQPFVSNWGSTGLVLLVPDLNNFQVQRAGTSLLGSSFPDGMGAIYNGTSTIGNPGGDVFLFLFDQPQWGVGAYIQAHNYGPFDGAIYLVDTSGNLLGFYSFSGVSSGQASDLLFVGAISDAQDVGQALFVVCPCSPADYEIGTVGLATPEPSTMLLFGPSLLGLLGAAGYRRKPHSN